MTQLLYSIILELCATSNAILPATMGQQAHGLFLNLIRQGDLLLSERHHEKNQPRPFTVSALRGAQEQERTLLIREGQLYQLRVTLLDGGPLWHCLNTQLLKSQTSAPLTLGTAEFQLHRILSTPQSDPTGWAGYTDWQALATAHARPKITLNFTSPTAFSSGDRRFSLFPEPLRVWDSLMRSWNLYAPEILHLEKQSLREFVTEHVVVSDYDLYTTTWHFRKSTQKGFVGTCTYLIQTENIYAPQLTALASFAHFCGIGYKTPMGMGQVRMESSHTRRSS